MATNKEFCWANSRFCCDVMSSKCILGYRTKAATKKLFEILNMLELLWVPAASPWYPSKSQLIMGWPSQATWPWELMKCGFTIMNFLPAAETPGGDSHPDWTDEQQGCNWVVTQLHYCGTTLNASYWIQIKNTGVWKDQSHMWKIHFIARQKRKNCSGIKKKQCMMQLQSEAKCFGQSELFSAAAPGTWPFGKYPSRDFSRRRKNHLKTNFQPEYLWWKADSSKHSWFFL